MITDKDVRVFLPLFLFFSIIISLAFLSSFMGNLKITGNVVSLSSPVENANLKGVVTFRATADAADNIINMSFYYNSTSFAFDTNETPQQTVFEVPLFDTTLIPDNRSYSITAIGFNSAHEEVSRSEKLGITIDNNPPAISYSSPTPENNAVISGNLTINVTAYDAVGLDSIFLYVDSFLNKTCASSGCYYNEVLSNGTHVFYASANDSLGNNALLGARTITIGSIFVPTATFNLTVAGSGGASSKVFIYNAGTTNLIKSYNLTSGTATNENIADARYDLLFTTTDSSLNVLLRNINLSADSNKNVGLDWNIPITGFGQAYAVTNTYTTSSIKLLLAYNESKFTDDDYLGLYKCSNWNFVSRSCPSNWTKLILGTDAKQSVLGNYFEIETSSLSGFAIKQESVPFWNYTTNASNTSNASSGSQKCSEGNITSDCMCGGTIYDAGSGYCCSEMYQMTSCVIECGQGKISSKCVCGAEEHSSGYCCAGEYQEDACPGYSEGASAEEEAASSSILPIILIVFAVAIIGGIASYIFYFSKQHVKEPERVEPWGTQIRLKPAAQPAQSALQAQQQLKPAFPEAQKIGAEAEKFTPEKIQEILKQQGSRMTGEKKKKIIEELKKLSEEK